MNQEDDYGQEAFRTLQAPPLEPIVRRKKQEAHFRVSKPGPVFDGKREAVVTISPRSDGGFLITIRPPHRQPRTLPLEDVAEMVCWKVAKQDAQEKMRAKK